MPLNKEIKPNQNLYFMHFTLDKKNGLLKGSPLEFLGLGPFKYIIPNTARYFKYIDDILLINPQDLDLHSITDRLNNVETSRKFTYELESNSTLHFLYILLIRNINKP